MRILVNDYAGHTFQPQLSRELARRGHSVVHSFRAEGHGRQGALSKLPGDPETLSFAPIVLTGRAGAKRGVIGRALHEYAYGRAASRLVKSSGAEVVLSANTPLLAQRMLLRSTHRGHAGFIYWMEDWISAAQTRRARRRLGGLGAIAGRALARLERSSLRGSDHVVAMTPAFVDVLAGYGLRASRVTVIPNWGAKDEIVPTLRDNSWAAEQGLIGKRVFLYAGSLGIKHNPGLLAELGKAVPDSVVVLVGEGGGADFVRAEAARLGADNVRVLPSQPYDRLSEVLGSADVLVAILDPHGAKYSMPSKILTYLCAGRPIIASVPRDNLGALAVLDADAGIVIEPGNDDEFLSAAHELIGDPERRAKLGANGRAYAERTFDIGHIADQFETVLKASTSATR